MNEQINSTSAILKNLDENKNEICESHMLPK